MVKYFLMILCLYILSVESNFWEFPVESDSVCSKEKGVCKKITECFETFKKLREKEEKIPICEHNANIMDSTMCCPHATTNEVSVKNSLDSCIDQNFEHRRLFTEIGAGYILDEEFPNIAEIGWTSLDGKASYDCGGTILNSKYILTVARCTSGKSGKKPDVVRVGGCYISTDTKGEFVQTIKISEVIKHPKYKSSQNTHDIGLLKLETDIKFSKKVAPVCLWDSSVQIDSLKTAGHGSAGFGTPRSDLLLKKSMKVIERNECTSVFSQNPDRKQVISEEQICTTELQSNNEGSKTCIADLGGPLQTIKVVERNNAKYEIPILVGLTSFGIGCVIDTPDIFTNVSHYTDWISSVVN